MRVFIIYFLAKVKEILLFGLDCTVQQLTDFLPGQMAPLALFQGTQRKITNRLAHKQGDSVTDFFKPSPDNSVFPFFERKTQPAAPVVHFIHFEIFRFEKIIVNADRIDIRIHAEGLNSLIRDIEHVHKIKEAA